MLAKKFKNSADKHIVTCCQINLRALDAFADIVNISYQRTFAKAIRETIARCLDTAPGPELPDQNSVEDENIFDPELLKYRWTVGYSGLWFMDMGRPQEAKMRRFENT